MIELGGSGKICTRSSTTNRLSSGSHTNCSMNICSCLSSRNCLLLCFHQNTLPMPITRAPPIIKGNIYKMGSYFFKPTDAVLIASPTNSPSPPIQILPSPSRSFSSLEESKERTRMLKPPTPPKRSRKRTFYGSKRVNKRRRLNFGLP